MSILQYATPGSRYYQYDRDILEDYQSQIDAYNAEVEAYNKAAEEWQAKADAYNQARFNAPPSAYRYFKGQRRFKPEYLASIPERPEDWSRQAPVFEGGFSEEDVDAYLKEAEGRARRRGQSAATAQAIMTTPGQFYTVGRDTFGSTPEVSLAGMSGFGSTAVGFAKGGVAGLFQRYAQGGQVAPLRQGGIASLFGQYP